MDANQDINKIKLNHSLIINQTNHGMEKAIQNWREFLKSRSQFEENQNRLLAQNILSTILDLFENQSHSGNEIKFMKLIDGITKTLLNISFSYLPKANLQKDKTKEPRTMPFYYLKQLKVKEKVKTAKKVFKKEFQDFLDRETVDYEKNLLINSTFSIK